MTVARSSALSVDRQRSADRLPNVTAEASKMMSLISLAIVLGLLGLAVGGGIGVLARRRAQVDPAQAVN